MKRHQYRSNLGIISDILSVIMDDGSEGSMISSISRRANLSNDVIVIKCSELTSAGLLESRHSERNHIFTITGKGMEFFQKLQKFIDTIREVKIRY